MLLVVNVVEYFVGFFRDDLLGEVQHREAHTQDGLDVVGELVVLDVNGLVNAPVHDSEPVFVAQHVVHDARPSRCDRKVARQLIHV